MSTTKTMYLKALIVCLSASATLAFAQTGKPIMTGSEAALYQGADRQQRLLEGALKEGEVSVYDVYPALAKVLDAFSKKYGIKVKVWRSGSEGVLQRVITEAKGGHFDVDIVQNNSPENEAASREKLLQEVKSPYFADLIPQALPTHHQWTGLTVDVWVAAYNTNKVKKEDLPKTYQDLLNPKWKGLLGIEAYDQAWFGTMLQEMGEDKGVKLFGSIMDTNPMSLRKGHSLLTMLVSSGEVPMALTVYSWIPEQLKKKGAPIENFPLEPLIAQTSTIAMLKKAPHPNAAVLLYDFLLSEGQTLLQQDSFVPVSKKFPATFGGLPIRFVDPGQAIDLEQKWTKSFEETITKRSK